MASRPHTREDKPPQELIDAIQASANMTAPSGNAASGATHAIRAHLTHETPQHMTEEQRETLAERVGGDDTTLLQTRQDRQAHIAELRHEHAAGGPQYDRNHPGAGHQGQGDAGTVQSRHNVKAGTRTSKLGPHYKG